ncbi:MAG: BufA1 family periplasmic bufferin-type metallophore [Reyranella sp.]
MRNSLTIAAALSTALLLGAAAQAQNNASEKCYGVVKAGKNDCQTTTSSCAGTSKKDRQADAWINVPKGACDKIVGGVVKG